MIIPTVKQCQRCKQDFDTYDMPHFHPRWCKTCKPIVFYERERALHAHYTGVQALVMQTLTCEECGKSWERESRRGRRPKYCPDCSGGVE